MSECKETMCSRCAHLQVCMNKELYLRAQEAVDDHDVYLGSNEKGDVSIIKLRNISWIKATNLVCINFLERRSQPITNVL